MVFGIGGLLAGLLPLSLLVAPPRFEIVWNAPSAGCSNPSNPPGSALSLSKYPAVSTNVNQVSTSPPLASLPISPHGLHPRVTRIDNYGGDSPLRAP